MQHLIHEAIEGLLGVSAPPHTVLLCPQHEGAPGPHRLHLACRGLHRSGGHMNGITETILESARGRSGQQPPWQACMV